MNVRWVASAKQNRADIIDYIAVKNPRAPLKMDGVIKMTKKLTTYDPAAALVDNEEMVAFMADAFETSDAAYIAKAQDVVARAKGMALGVKYTFKALGNIARAKQNITGGSSWPRSK